MSATTMAAATTTETVDPLPGSRPGQAALPVSDAAMLIQALSVKASGVMPLSFFIVQAAPRQFKQC
jgi:hypothetical protein